MEAVKNLDHSREELPGVEGSERSEGELGRPSLARRLWRAPERGVL